LEVLTYEDLIRSIRQQYDPPLITVIGTLREWGMDTSGPYRVYWPADSFYVADGISLAAARELQALFNDPRVKPSLLVEGATLEVARPRRERSHQFPTDGRVLRRIPYKRDHHVGIRLIKTEDRVDFEEEDRLEQRADAPLYIPWHE